MNKKEAASFLDVSERAIERYTSKGKLHVRYEDKPSGGTVAVYDEDEVAKLKSELEQPAPLTTLSTTTPTPRQQTTSLSPVGASEWAQVFSAAFVAQQETQASTVSITDKLTLNLEEAARLSGLSRGFLAAAIHDGKLNAAKRGRGWNIKRSDLDTYINKL
jgi:excisionase family DNA binding protein